MEERTSKQVIRAWVALAVSLVVWFLVATAMLHIEGRSLKDSDSDLLNIWGALGLVALPLMLFVAGLISLIWLGELISQLGKGAASPKGEP